MTLAVFPALDGIEWATSKRADFKTSVFESLSGRESRVKLRQYPRYTFKLSFEFLVENRDETQLSTLLEFMLLHGGSYDAFLFTDPNDHAVEGHWFDQGTGTQTAFQLRRYIGYWGEPVENLNGAPLIYNNGLLQAIGTDYTLSSTGVVTFVTPPALSAPLRWTGAFYYRVRFAQDGYDFTQLMKDLHECRDIELTGSVRNTV